MPGGVDGHRPERAAAQHHRRQRPLDALAVRHQGQGRLDVRLDVSVGAQPAQRAARRFHQLHHLAGLLVQDEAPGLDARDFQHLLQQQVQPLRLPLQHLHVARVAGLSLLQAARERVGETLDAGQRRLQLVRREAQETILARFTLGCREHRAGAREEGRERAQIAQAAVELQAERAHHLVVRPQRHPG